ncbi:MAG: DNA-processing protein DprA [Bacteroidota bacterium]
MNETEFWLAFHRLPGVGSQRLRSLQEHFGSLEAAWNAPASALRAIKGFGPDLAAGIVEGRKRLEPGTLLEGLERAGVWALTLLDAPYPSALRALPDPPAILYGRGTIPPLARAIAVVGTRNATEYGLRVAREISSNLARSGVLVISGLAAGIDAAAHRGALEAGSTLAVLGCGPDRVYPRENRVLYGRILEAGALLSEYPPGTPPEPGHFPARNRIVAGLAAAVVVVEAGKKSGALITADLGLEMGKEVCAVPGPIDSPQSMGTNRLLAQGARLVSSAEDVLSEFGWTPTPKAIPPLPPEEQRIFGALDGTPRHLDELARALGMDPAVVISAMVVLELKSLAVRLPGQRYMRRST